MTIKQRKGLASYKDSAAPGGNEESDYNADKDKQKRVKNDKEKSVKGRRKKLTFRALIFGMLAFYGIVGVILYYFYSKYGPAIILGQGWKDYKWTAYKWRTFIDENERTVLLIGGPHRGGTTILWEGIKTHPEIVGFGDRFETGADYSEGVLMQDVYPRFGVGFEFKKNFGRPNAASGEDDDKNAEGLGRYALNPKVHWTKENKRKMLEDPRTMSMLLNRFGPYWDRNKKFKSDGMMKAKVWVEKSPQNAVLSTFLEGIYNMPVKRDGTVDLDVTRGAKKTERLATKFVYITRHPIANVYAIDKFVQESMGGFIDFEILLRNYIALHKYMKMDEIALESPVMWVRLEDFASNPHAVLKEVYSFLEVSTDHSIIDGVVESLGDIRSDPNKRYITKWCQEGIATKGHLIEKYAEELEGLDLGYDLQVCK